MTELDYKADHHATVEKYGAALERAAARAFEPPPVVMTEHDLTRIAFGKEPLVEPEQDVFSRTVREYQGERTVTAGPPDPRPTYVIDPNKEKTE